MKLIRVEEIEIDLKKSNRHWLIDFVQKFNPYANECSEIDFDREKEARIEYEQQIRILKSIGYVPLDNYLTEQMRRAK